MPKGRRYRSRRRANNNGRTVNGAYPARSREALGCKSPIALLKALDVFEPLCKRPKLGIVDEQLGDGLGSHEMLGGY